MKQLKKPGESKRAVPTAERKIIEPLVDRVERIWGSGAPPVSSLADIVVHMNNFMSLKRLSPFFPKVLGNKKLVDLGAGEPGTMIHFALRCGVSEYVAVDRYWDYSRRTPPFTNVSYVNQDMLEFLSEQPDSSANVVMLGIDNIVLGNEHTMAGMRYAEMLLKQIQRVVPQGGIAFGMNCAILCELTDMGFENIKKIPGRKLPENYDGGGIFQKL